MPPTLAEQHPAPPHLPEIARRLRERYLPDPPKPRVSGEPLNGLISTILSQQNVAATTRRQFEGLRHAFPRWEIALAAGPDAIEDALRAAGGGLARVKAQYIHGALAALDETRGQLSLKDTRRMTDTEIASLLEGLPGVGPKTAACVLLFDLARPAMPVDTHIDRITHRLELTPAKWGAVKIQRWYEAVLPPDWTSRYTFHVSNIRHGRETCKAIRPRCAECVLNDLCPSAGIFLSGQEAPRAG